jgi:hypothetical protein
MALSFTHLRDFGWLWFDTHDLTLADISRNPLRARLAARRQRADLLQKRVFVPAQA